MSLIPSHPFLRVKNYLQDGPLPQMRWVKKEVPLSPLGGRRALRVTEVPGVGTKETNPNWRKEWDWVVLRSTGDEVCYPFFFNQPEDIYGRMKWLPIKTRLFAMRVGSDPFWVYTVNKDGRIHIPEFYNILECSVRRGVYLKEDLTWIAAQRGFDITLI